MDDGYLLSVEKVFLNITFLSALDSGRKYL